ncbi:MAG: guanylate kinase [Pirellulaceae bacterium]
MNAAAGKLVIVSGPSGAGKSTVVQRLLVDCPIPLCVSVSATTRAPRPGEQDGVHYHFLAPEEFQRRRARGEFLECKEVFGCGDWYGTLRSEVASGHAAGKWVLLEIDVQGALAVLAEVPEAVTIFLHPGSLEELATRLQLRGTESAQSLARRLAAARAEMNYVGRYQYEVINDTVDRAVREICTILRRCGEGD